MTTGQPLHSFRSSAHNTCNHPKTGICKYGIHTLSGNDWLELSSADVLYDNKCTTWKKGGSADSKSDPQQENNCRFSKSPRHKYMWKCFNLSRILIQWNPKSDHAFCRESDVVGSFNRSPRRLSALSCIFFLASFLMEAASVSSSTLGASSFVLGSCSGGFRSKIDSTISSATAHRAFSHYWHSQAVCAGCADITTCRCMVLSQIAVVRGAEVKLLGVQ